MKVMATLVLVASCALSGVATPGTGLATVQNDVECGVLESAIHDYTRIKTDAKRKDVEKVFLQDGGLQFAGKTRYTYRACRYLHVEVSYKSPVTSSQIPSPDDLVDSVSKLYVDYPAKD